MDAIYRDIEQNILRPKTSYHSQYAKHLHLGNSRGRNDEE